MPTVWKATEITGLISYNVDLAIMPAEASAKAFTGTPFGYTASTDGETALTWYDNASTGLGYIIRGYATIGGYSYYLDKTFSKAVPVEDRRNLWLVIDHSVQNSYTGSVANNNYKVIDNQTSFVWSESKPVKTATNEVFNIPHINNIMKQKQTSHLVADDSYGVMGKNSEIRWVRPGGAYNQTPNASLKLDSNNILQSSVPIKQPVTRHSATNSQYNIQFDLTKVGQVVSGFIRFNSPFPNNTTSPADIIPAEFTPAYNQTFGITDVQVYGRLIVGTNGSLKTENTPVNSQTVHVSWITSQ